MSSHLQYSEHLTDSSPLANANFHPHRCAHVLLTVRYFFAQRSTKKVKGVTDAGLKPRPMKKLAVLGGGLMGSGICTAALAAGMRVTLKEVNEKFLQVVSISKCRLHLNWPTLPRTSCCILLTKFCVISYNNRLVVSYKRFSEYYGWPITLGTHCCIH